MTRLINVALLAGIASAASAADMTEEFCNPPVEGHVHASTLLPVRDGVLVAWFEGTKEGAGDVAIRGARRRNGKWGETRTLAKVNPDSPHWNPVLRRADDGRIELYFKVGRNCGDWRTYVRESRDDGETWGAPRELVFGEVRGGRGPVKNKCLKLRSGRWLAPASREIGPWRAFVDISDDDGRTWRDAPPFPAPKDWRDDGKTGVIQPTLWESASGVHAFMRSRDGWIWRSDSTDGGETWSEMRRTPLENLNSGIDLVKASNGVVYLVRNGRSPVAKGWGVRSHLEIMESRDDGETWRVFKTLVDDDVEKAKAEKRRIEYTYPAIVEIRPGVLGVTYTWNRRRIAYVELPLLAVGGVCAAFGAGRAQGRQEGFVADRSACEIRDGKFYQNGRRVFMKIGKPLLDFASAEQCGRLVSWLPEYRRKGYTALELNCYWHHFDSDGDGVPDVSLEPLARTVDAIYAAGMYPCLSVETYSVGGGRLPAGFWKAHPEACARDADGERVRDVEYAQDTEVVSIFNRDYRRAARVFIRSVAAAVDHDKVLWYETTVEPQYGSVRKIDYGPDARREYAAWRARNGGVGPSVPDFPVGEEFTRDPTWNRFRAESLADWVNGDAAAFREAAGRDALVAVDFLCAQERLQYLRRRRSGRVPAQAGGRERASGQLALGLGRPQAQRAGVCGGSQGAGRVPRTEMGGRGAHDLQRRQFHGLCGRGAAGGSGEHAPQRQRPRLGVRLGHSELGLGVLALRG